VSALPDSHPTADVVDLRLARLAEELRAFDPLLTREIREHLLARIDQWGGSPGTSPARREQLERYRLLADALR